MTSDRSLERAARSWLEEGPTQAPDRAVDAALLRINFVPQERDLRLPRRNPRMNRYLLAVAAALIVAIGAALITFRPVSDVGPATTAAPTAIPTTVPTATLAARVDYSDLPGRLLIEHLGNALNMSESANTDPNGGIRRFYFMDPGDMQPGGVREFLPGRTNGKSSLDVSSDGSKVVFQSYAEVTGLFEANLDGTGFRALPLKCACSRFYPDYDPSATKVVYVRVEGAESWLEILDLATNKVTKLASTVGPAGNAVPEQPAWSPDGSTIAFSRITWALPNDHDIGTVHFGEKPPLSGVLSLVDVATGVVLDLPVPGDLKPGDPNWSPDSTTILFTAGPLSTTAGVAGPGFSHQNYAIRRDGTGLRTIPGIGSPEYLPDGRHILFKTDCVNACPSTDSMGVMLSDYSAPLWVNVHSMDLTDVPQGFSQIAHWVP